MTTPLPTAFGAQLRRYRERAGLTQEALAERAGLTPQAISALERGERRRPYPYTVQVLADALQLGADERATLLAARAAPLHDVPPSDTTNAKQLMNAPLLRPASLPAAPNPLLGRHHEQADVVRLLTDPACRIVTVVAPGGMGKTRLALQVAEQLAPAFAEGTVWVALAAVADAAQVAVAIADALGCVVPPDGAPHEQILVFLRERSLLLVLDNFEHVLDATPVIRAIVEHAPQVRLLVTSRQRLHVDGEWVLDLAGLAVPPAQHREEVTHSPAVRLFVQRAQQADHAFVLGTENDDSVAQICRVVDGMPLAIELAAAWVRVLSCADILAEINRGLDLLHSTAVGGAGIAARHRSMRAVFDASWSLLTPDEQRVLCGLSVFGGGFTRQAAEDVAGATLPLLAALLDKALVRRMTAPGSAVRYDLHPLVRQYAAERLQDRADMHAGVHARHMRYVVRLLADHDHRLNSGEQHTVILELAAELANLRAAWAWAIAHDQIAVLEPAWNVVHWLCEYRMWFQDGEQLFRSVVHALQSQAGGDSSENSTQTADHTRLLGHALIRHGYFVSRLGRLAVAHDELGAGVALLRRGEHGTALITGTLFHGVVAWAMGNLPAAQQRVAEAFQLAADANNRWLLALSAQWHAVLAQTCGNHKGAKDWFEYGLGLMRELGSSRGILVTLTFFSVTLQALGDLDAAQAALQESLQRGGATNDPWIVGTSLNYLGTVAAARGDYTEARRLFHESLLVLREGGNRWDIARVLNNLGDAALAVGDGAAAHHTLRAALEVALEAHALPDALHALRGIAALQVYPACGSDTVGWLRHLEAHPHVDASIRDAARQLRVLLAAQRAPSVDAVVEHQEQR